MFLSGCWHSCNLLKLAIDKLKDWHWTRLHGRSCLHVESGTHNTDEAPHSSMRLLSCRSQQSYKAHAYAQQAHYSCLVMHRGVVAMRSESPQLKQFIGREMLRGAFAAVASAGPNQQAELLHLARDILAMESPFPAAPREVSPLCVRTCNHRVMRCVWTSHWLATSYAVLAPCMAFLSSRNDL